MQLEANISKKKYTIEYLFSIVVALLPVFATYDTFVPGFSFADLILAVFFIIAVTWKHKKPMNYFAVNPALIILALYLIIMFAFVSFMFQDGLNYSDAAIRIIRYFFYIMIIAVCCTKIFDIELCKRAIIIVSVLATIYIIIQLFMYNVFDVLLRGYLPFFKLYDQSYVTQEYMERYTAIFYRPTSFFLEPAHYARYVIIGIIILLYDNKKITSKYIAIAVFISAGVLISTSSQGYGLLLIVWIIWLFARVRHIESRNLRYLGYCVIVMLPFIFIALLNLSFVQDTLMRTFSGGLQDTNSAIGARLGDIKYYFELDPLFKLIGMGFGTVPEGAWFASAVYWLYGSGLIVFALYLAYGVKCLRRLQGASKYIMLIFVVLFFTDDSFYSYMCIIYTSLSLLLPYKTGDVIR